jgi:hypothetical protein
MKQQILNYIRSSSPRIPGRSVFVSPQSQEDFFHNEPTELKTTIKKSKLTFGLLANHILDLITVSVIPKSCVWINRHAIIKAVITVWLTVIPVSITNWLII